jgi:hypothetical protein
MKRTLAAALFLAIGALTGQEKPVYPGADEKSPSRRSKRSI